MPDRVGARGPDSKTAGIPAGMLAYFASGSGGVARSSLNHRLQDGMPPASCGNAAQIEHNNKANPVKLDKAAGPAEKDNAAPEFLGLVAFCHALMSANGFLYVD